VLPVQDYSELGWNQSELEGPVSSVATDASSALLGGLVSEDPGKNFGAFCSVATVERSERASGDSSYQIVQTRRCSINLVGYFLDYRHTQILREPLLLELFTLFLF
jgi:hypothetical protein